MKNRTYFLGYIFFLTCLFGSRWIYCHVMELEYYGPEVQYFADCDKAGRVLDLYEWAEYRAERDAKQAEWVDGIMHEIGMEIAATFDPEFEAKCPSGSDR